MSKKTFYPVGSYKITWFDENHDTIKKERWDRGLFEAREHVKTIPCHSYQIDMVVDNSLCDIHSPSR